MKQTKTLLLFGALLTVFVTGCSNHIEAMPVEVITNQECDNCAIKDEDDTCSKEVKVIKYKDNCNYSCGFPVTVRTVSTCKYGGGL